MTRSGLTRQRVFQIIDDVVKHSHWLRLTEPRSNQTDHYRLSGAIFSIS
jgi:hypothetical protein